MAILVKNSDIINYSLIKENNELKKKIKGE